MPGKDDPSVGLLNQLRVDVGFFDVFSVFVAKGNEPAPVLGVPSPSRAVEVALG